MLDAVKRFLGLHDRKQAARTAEVAEYVHNKKNQFTSDMLRIQAQARDLHVVALKATESSGRLIEVVDDVTAKVAQATGKYKRV